MTTAHEAAYAMAVEDVATAQRLVEADRWAADHYWDDALAGLKRARERLAFWNENLWHVPERGQ